MRYDNVKRKLLAFKKVPNDKALAVLAEQHKQLPDVLVVEMIASYGMPVGREVFETCVWVGRFLQAWPGETERITRGAIKLHLCGSMRAKDANVRQALIDAFGGKDKAIGTKRAPGALHGVSGDVWSALAVAVTYADRTAS